MNYCNCRSEAECDCPKCGICGHVVDGHIHDSLGKPRPKPTPPRREVYDVEPASYPDIVMFFVFLIVLGGSILFFIGS